MIKEREYLLITLVPVFNISISYIYILIRGRDGFLGFGTVLGCFEAGTNGTRTGQLSRCPGGGSQHVFVCICAYGFEIVYEALWDSPGTLRGPRQSHRFVRGFGGRVFPSRMVLPSGVVASALVYGVYGVLELPRAGLLSLNSLLSHRHRFGARAAAVLIFRGRCGRFRW